MNRLLKRGLGILVCLLCFAGCGGKTGTGDQVEVPPAPPAEWKTKGFAISGDVVEEQALWVANYIPWDHGETNLNASVTEAGVVDGKIYRFTLLTKRQGGGSVPMPTGGILEIYDAVSMEMAKQEFTPEQMGVADGENAQVTGMALVDGQTVVFQVQDYRKDDEEDEYVLERNRIVYAAVTVAGAGGTVADKAGVAGAEGATGGTAGTAGTIADDSTGTTGTMDATGTGGATTGGTAESGGVDVLPFYLEKEILPETSVKPRWDWTVESICDGDGNSYVRAGNSKHPFFRLYALDREGKLLFDYEGDEWDQVGKPLKTGEGDLIFPISVEGGSKTQLTWFDPQNGQKKVLAMIEREFIRQFYGMQGNDVYYENRQGIVKWDIVSGERKLVLQFSGNGGLGIFSTMLVLREGQLPVLRLYGRISSSAEEDWIVELAGEAPEQKDTVRVASLDEYYNLYAPNVLTRGAGRPIECVTMTGRRNPEFEYSYENGKGMDQEDFRNRIMAQIAAGNGPDILYVTMEDMVLMQEKDYLMDLGELLTKEDLEEVMPAALELGTIDGHLVGMLVGVTAETTLTSSDVWDKDSISAEEFLELLESGRFSSGGIINRINTLASTGIMFWMTEIYGNEENFLIDWKQGESHFEDEMFVRILEAAKKYGGPGGFEKAENAFIGEGGCPAVSVSGFSDYHWYSEQLGEKFRDVGMFDGSGKGYLSSRSVIVVNSRTAHPEAAKAYLKCLLSREIQGMADYHDHESVLKMDFSNVIFQHCIYDDNREFIDSEIVSREEARGFPTEDIEVLWMSEGTFRMREDGTTVADDWKEFLENCSAAPREHKTIWNIMWEESPAYFKGDKSARDVAKIIDNRVQLYLDERK